MSTNHSARPGLALVLALLLPFPVKAQDKALAAKIVEVAGAAEFLRSVPKHFATLKAVDPARRRVTLLIEGERLAKVWPLADDAEVKRAGWWARLDQLAVGDRVWAWFQTDRTRQPVAISMLTDELSEEDMHGPGVTVEARTADTLTLKPEKGKNWTLKTAKADFRLGSQEVSDALKPGAKVYVQSQAGAARLVLNRDALEALRVEQKAALRKRWVDEGLPGQAAVLHRFSGEMDLLLDHEAMRWSRSLKVGDRISLRATPPIAGLVKEVKPWRERTLVRLVVAGVDQAELSAGQRLFLNMTPPPDEVEKAVYPPDCDRPRTRAERVEWFLASVYCSCTVAGDGCTGMVYTLASCNPNACAMPNHLREAIGEKIDKGLTDRQAFEELLKENGPDLLRPHLVP
jgi:hypothetical protein